MSNSICLSSLSRRVLITTLASLAQALTKVPAMPTTSPPSRSNSLQTATNSLHVAFSAGPLTRRNSAMVRVPRGKPLQQPDGLQVAPTLPRQASGTVDAVEVADQVEFEQGRRVERRLARCQIAAGVDEPQGGQVQRLDVGIDGPHQVVGADVVLDARQQQRLLGARGALLVASAHGPPNLPIPTRLTFYRTGAGTPEQGRWPIAEFLPNRSRTQLLHQPLR
jgi:hypothetical protein